MSSRAIIVGHLTVTTPVIAAVLLVPFYGLRALGPYLFVYYVLAGMTVGWQWYTTALPAWKKWLFQQGMHEDQVENLARCAGLTWPGNAMIGPFAFHTTAAAVCGIHLGPWLLSRWFVWILPLTGASAHTPKWDEYLQHFELASIVPACIVGYLLFRYLHRMATYAWIVPAVLLLYKMVTFIEPYTSILAPHPWTRFSYFFVILKSMPMLAPPYYGGADAVRIVTQIDFVGPFYSGLAYTAGALAMKYSVFVKVFGDPANNLSEPENDNETACAD